jgi:hypothetical protein
MRQAASRPMKVIESQTMAKRGRPEFCEDLIVESDDFLAVIDGVTDKHGFRYSGARTGGRFAADLLASEIRRLDKKASSGEAISQLSGALAEAIDVEHGQMSDIPLPGASAAIYSRKKREIWRIGTIHILIDGMPYPGSKAIDEITSRARAAYTKALLKAGRYPEEISAEDPGRKMILPLLELQNHFANDPHSEFAFALFNGDPIPDDLYDVLAVPDGAEVVLASDGYPRAAPSLEASELILEERLRIDPMMIDPPPQTKGKGPRDISFDDRAYLRFGT